MVRTKTKKLRGGHYGRGMKSGRGKGKKGGNGMAGLGGHRKIWLIIHDKKPLRRSRIYNPFKNLQKFHNTSSAQ